MKRPYRVAALATHPIQYQAPLFRFLAADPQLEIEVFFLSDISVRGYYDPGFTTQVNWDVPILDGYRYSFLPCFGRSNALSFWRPFTRGIRQRLTAGRYDALWVHGYWNQGLIRAVAAASSAGIKVLLRGDSQLAGSEKKYPKAALKRIALGWLFRMIDGFLAVGTRNREYYRYYGVPEERIFPMPYAVDNEFFRSRARRASGRREELRAALGLDPGRPVILYASKLQAHKRPADLLDAFVAASYLGAPPVHLLFVGDGDQKSALEARAKALSAGNVRFLGFKNQSELPAYFDLCDIFVLPSSYEPWGLVVNEVMNAGKAVVVSDRVGSAADLVVHGVNGFVFRAGDVSALADKLARTIGDPAMTLRMGFESRKIIRRWNFEADRQGLLQALDALVPESTVSKVTDLSAARIRLPSTRDRISRNE